MALSIPTSMDTLRNALVRHLAELETQCNAALQIYRGHNRSARSTPPPAYFDSRVELSAAEISEFDASVGIAKETAAAAPSLPVASLGEARSRIIDTAHSALEEFKQIEELASGRGG